MNKEELMHSFDNIVPNEAQKQRMLLRLLNGKKNQQRQIRYKKFVPVTALAALVLCVALSYPLLSKPIFSRDGDLAIGEGDAIGNESTPAVSPYPETDIDIAPGKISNVFTYGGKEYHKLNAEQLKAFGLSSTINSKDIGNVITTIQEGGDGVYDDRSLVGCKVYEYLPTHTQAVVIVNKNGENSLYGFSTFLSYQKNQDEDAISYLELYNVKQASDISRIEFYSYKDNGSMQVDKSVQDIQDITRFYNSYKLLVNSSDAYFNALKSNMVTDRGESSTVVSVNPPDAPDYKAVPPDEPSTHIAADVGITTDPSDGVVQISPANPGTIGNALSDSKIIRIYLQSGLYMETVYYPHIRFISRFQLTEEFASYIDLLCK